MNRKYKYEFNHEDILKAANSSLGWYRKSGMNAVNVTISPEVLETKIKDGAGWLNPLNYYLRVVGILVVESYTIPVRTDQREGNNTSLRFLYSIGLRGTVIFPSSTSASMSAFVTGTLKSVIIKSLFIA